ncbi:menaquinone-dependent protoporphyrinogen IX dehydrogenase [Neptunitalea lumnitzerae]|uniref:Protoporphyrinogen IX dehydrogenase [quinone] n=1 Tax=Neptunitalea lumnitzerae TaxID=2965509 RepID=A0ABQ5MLP1_9FLAO|nr:menaquinone-dependent protoporphyrinogen IX dehydrogenase [Neptunitalea sp. Y10]GLB50320.1 protoporphyrinogen oxidase [Neptunitalea sp. Y10]
MEKIAIIYASVDGQTFKICKRISAQLQQQGYIVEMTDIATCTYNLTEFTTVIIGASIRYGTHAKKVTRFINNNIAALNKVKTAFFSVNLVARKTNKNTFDTNPYVQKFFTKITWKPNLINVFAGKLDYDTYPFYDRMLIKLIMKNTKGPTKTNGPIEYTNWTRVDSFANQVAELTDRL